MRRRQQKPQGTQETQQTDGAGFPVYVGVARVEEGMRTASIEDALADAYEKGKAAGAGTRYRIVDIVVSGNNPINECIVVVTPTP